MSGQQSVSIQLLGGIEAFMPRAWVEEFEEEFREIEKYPHVVMILIADRYCEEFRREDGRSLPGILDVIRLMEVYLSQGDEDCQNMIEVSFIESIYNDDAGLLSWIREHSGPNLRYEIMAFLANESGYRIINVLKALSLLQGAEDLCRVFSNLAVVDQLRAMEIPFQNGRPLDPWGHPYKIEIVTVAGTSNRRLHVTSRCTLRGFGKDIVSIDELPDTSAPAP